MAKESTQKKLERVRPPRVNISYDVETGGAIEMKELPFVMGVLGDFTGQPDEPLAKLKDRKFVDVTLDNFDDVLASMKPHLQFSVENKLSEDPNAGKLGVDLTFKSLDDFSPDAVARQVKPLKELLDLRTKLSDLRGTLQGNDKLDDILQATLGDEDKMKKLQRGARHRGRVQWLKPRPHRPHRPRLPQTTEAESARHDRRAGPVGQGRGRQRARQGHGQAVRRPRCWRVRSPCRADTEAMINARIAQIDHLISLQLNEVMHAPEFQKLEGTWRGLRYLLGQRETSDMLKIKVLNVQQEGAAARPAARARVRSERAVQEGVRGRVRRVRRRAVRRADRRLRVRQVGPGHRAAREDRAGGGRGARAVHHRGVARDAQPRELHAARRAARSRPRSSTPPNTRGGRRSARAKIRATWRSRCRACCCACRTARTPCRWTRSTTRSTWTGPTTSKYLWGNAAWALGARRDQRVRGLRLVRVHPRRGERRPGGRAAGAQFPDRRRRRRDEVPDGDAHHGPPREGAGGPGLRAAGASARAPSNAAFFSVQSAQKPKIYDSDAATANARISAQLPYIFAVSRFAHYLKAMMRDKIGGYMSQSEARDVPQHAGSRTTSCGNDDAPFVREGASGRSRKRASRWRKCPGSRVRIAPSRSCGRTSSWMN